MVSTSVFLFFTLQPDLLVLTDLTALGWTEQLHKQTIQLLAGMHDDKFTTKCAKTSPSFFLINEKTSAIKKKEKKRLIKAVTHSHQGTGSTHKHE